MLEIAKKILKEGPICDSCLGRQFAKLSTGLTNEERGKAIRIVLSMINGISPKEERKCWVCGGLFEEIDEWVERALNELQKYEYDTFLVGTRVSGLISENEEIIWAESGTTWAEPLKSELNRRVGKKIAKRTGKEVDFVRPDVLVLLDLEKESVKVEPSSLFLYGRYRKLIRGIPQTRWPHRKCGGKGCEECNFEGKQYPESVEELIKNPVIEEFDAEDGVLHGCGREDIDARMLGSGRPFVFEVKKPKFRNIDLSYLEKKINKENKGKIEVSDLKYTNRDAVREIKAIKANKVYRFRIELEKEIEKEKIIECLGSLDLIEQRTPSRVAHRRADLTRKRRVLRAELLDFKGKEAVIELECEGGLYVKELVSGDSGRTKPNISEILGVEAEVKELDVVDVKIND
ncbi:MAG: tRNA pseudouridine(54/55) synthase Pus10 [Candidatus Syntropharchaeia archaeon]